MWGQGRAHPMVLSHYLKVYFIIIFFDRVSIQSPGCPETYYVVQADLEPTELQLLLPPRAGIKGCTIIPGPQLKILKYFILNIWFLS